MGFRLLASSCFSSRTQGIFQAFSASREHINEVFNILLPLAGAIDLLPNTKAGKN